MLFYRLCLPTRNKKLVTEPSFRSDFCPLLLYTTGGVQRILEVTSKRRENEPQKLVTKYFGRHNVDAPIRFIKRRAGDQRTTFA